MASAPVKYSTDDQQLNSGEIPEELDEHKKAVIVCSAGNEGRTIPEVNKYPARFAEPSNPYGYLENIMVISASTIDTAKIGQNQFSSWVTTFAPGGAIQLAKNPRLTSPTNYATLKESSYGESTASIKV